MAISAVPHPVQLVENVRGLARNDAWSNEARQHTLALRFTAEPGHCTPSALQLELQSVSL
jgi:hypothetical protein